MGGRWEGGGQGGGREAGREGGGRWEVSHRRVARRQLSGHEAEEQVLGREYPGARGAERAGGCEVLGVVVHEHRAAACCHEHCRLLGRRPRGDGARRQGGIGTARLLPLLVEESLQREGVA